MNCLCLFCYKLSWFGFLVYISCRSLGHFPFIFCAFSQAIFCRFQHAYAWCMYNCINYNFNKQQTSSFSTISFVVDILTIRTSSSCLSPLWLWKSTVLIWPVKNFSFYEDFYFFLPFPLYQLAIKNKIYTNCLLYNFLELNRTVPFQERKDKAFSFYMKI